MRGLGEAAMLLERRANDDMEEKPTKVAALSQYKAQNAREQAHGLRDSVLSSKRFSGDTLQDEADSE